MEACGLLHEKETLSFQPSSPPQATGRSLPVPSRYL
ncbi:hypothetical protein CLOLEP_01536 [[Clostridium] leptum DSM 753]|uniref:Uncharacterized protein n=1 Tax=[Clostridium] leptum DSM 753 TaxID=428125 RepID=A7VSJ5_9FIRM|nr:hypothetical protein CLOLEP_01536 [[Clostridium] leptum DSM 753]